MNQTARGARKKLELQKRKGETKMKQMIEKLEDRTIRKYGFESRKTIFVFKVTEKLRKICK